MVSLCDRTNCIMCGLAGILFLEGPGRHLLSGLYERVELLKCLVQQLFAAILLLNPQ